MGYSSELVTVLLVDRILVECRSSGRLEGCGVILWMDLLSLQYRVWTICLARFLLLEEFEYADKNCWGRQIGLEEEATVVDNTQPPSSRIQSFIMIDWPANNWKNSMMRPLGQ